MSREDRIERAKELLNDIQEKQAACNKVVGLSFKDIDRVLKAVIAEKKSNKSDDEDERLDNPDKWGDRSGELLRGSTKEANPLKGEAGLPFTRDEVKWLLEQRDVILYEERPTSARSYKTYSVHEVNALIKGKCHPSIFKRKK